MLAGAMPGLAAEGGAGPYVMGFRGAGAAVVGPEGIYFNNQVLRYQGRINGAIPLEDGQIAGRGSVDALMNVPTLLWMTPLEAFGGRFGVSVSVPFARQTLNGTIGPLAFRDRISTFADPSFGLLLAGQAGQFHWQLAGTLFPPLGDYRKTKISNVALNRTSFDLSGALTWLEPTLGLDVSNVVGVTFNGANDDTRYRSGSEFHWEWSVSKKLWSGISVGAVGYHYRQISADRGRGAVLGPFRGQTTAFGASLGYEFQAGRLPVMVELRGYREVEARNRFKGDVALVSVTMPLWVKGAN